MLWCLIKRGVCEPRETAVIRALIRASDDVIGGGANAARSRINLALPVDVANRTTLRVGLIRLASRVKLSQYAPAESHRCFCIAEEMPLVCPFLRFSKAQLIKLLRDIHVGHVYLIGNRGIRLAAFLPEKAIIGSRYGFFARLALRITREDCACTIGYLVLAWIRGPRAAH